MAALKKNASKGVTFVLKNTALYADFKLNFIVVPPKSMSL